MSLRRGGGEPHQPTASARRHARRGLGERDESRDRAPQLVGQHAEAGARPRHPVRVPSRDALGPARECPLRGAPQGGILVLHEGLRQPLVARRRTVAEGDERVPPEPARVVPRHEQPLVLGDELAAVALEPVDERDDGVGVLGQLLAGPSASRRRGSRGRRPGRCRSRRRGPPARPSRRRASPRPSASSTRGTWSSRARRARRARPSGRRRCRACSCRSPRRAAPSARARRR